ncbi:MAG: 2-oxoglutarate dehydrogenase E1 component [Planctomycetia bacterium]|nr:2-oxoglutarate dehydrogenase E1 component [Planctomycetia bacterium]
MSSESAAFVEALYADWLRDPSSVPEAWRAWFAEAGDGDAFAARPQLGPSFDRGTVFNPPQAAAAPAGGPGDEVAALQERVDNLVRTFRVRGHLAAQLDPLGLPRPPVPELDPAWHGLRPEDLDRPFATRQILGVPDVLTLREILDLLRTTYCRSIGAQFMHILELPVQNWLKERMESCRNHATLTRQEQVRILTRLTDAVIFEEFIQKKFLGAKSFSCEGAETLLPLLDLAIEKAAGDGVREVVIGMAHRGRLNVLANILGKSPREIFQEFEDPDPERRLYRGDVKYHAGYAGDWRAAGGRTVHVSLCFNPSHLEFVNPVALGRMRAKQDRGGDLERSRGLVVLIHGDAAFAGQGVTQETLNLSQLDAYATGGALHVVVNNQIGFTTTPAEGRSTLYATDVARMLQVPVFHVNGEDPEAVAQAVRLALDFRARFRRDVFIDMHCYRRRGHNEADEPAFTNPLMVAAIEKRPPVREAYLARLLDMHGMSWEEADAIAVRRRLALEDELAVARKGQDLRKTVALTSAWTKYLGGSEDGVEETDTGVAKDRLRALSERLTTVPPAFHLHPKLARLLESRRRMGRGESPLDWGAAEALAFASLADEGHRIRFTGQDVCRGTFSHRHAVLYDQQDGHPFLPLGTLSDHQGLVEIANSPLSEIAVLAFEYGYSQDSPDALTAWEAQFGDFANVAQTIIDQFIVSGEDKWHRLSGLVLLLPHGMEGQGPEHSSARLERFLSLCAEDNIQVCQPSTPANFFHLLRRQVLRPWRKPLVVMTPKSLLRHPAAVSPLEDLAAGRFRRIIPDASVANPRRVFLCSGKLAVELEEAREARNRRDVAIVRVEQFYPLADAAIESALASVPSSVPALWVQEEPVNMGAWPYWRLRFGDRLPGGRELSVVARPESASPATGSQDSHKLEQRRLIESAFGR